jgi:uncharacterized protein (TIGR03435 family)
MALTYVMRRAKANGGGSCSQLSFSRAYMLRICAFAISVFFASNILLPEAVTQQQELPSFEVASVKPRSGARVYATATAPDRFHTPDTTLQQLIQYAFNIHDFQMVGGPTWIRSERFDVMVKAPSPTGIAERRLMLKRLLEQRFGLRTHVETRNSPVYELTFARRDKKLGPKATPASFDCGPFLTGERPLSDSPREPSGFPHCSSGGGLKGGLYAPRLNGITIARLASFVEPRVHRFVVDVTGLSGVFDFELTFAADPAPGLPPMPQAAPESIGPALWTALQEQLGLKLEASTAEREMLVVDHAELPSPD